MTYAPDPLGILRPGLVSKGGYYSAPDDSDAGTVWDRLASEDPAHAVVSAVDAKAEAQKSVRVVDLLAGELPEGAVADIGCGYGRIAKYLLPRRTFSVYVGVDSSATMLSLFAERHAERVEEQATPLLLVKSEISRLPLEDASLDAVFSCAVLLHNPKDATRAAIAEIHRVLKPGGKLVIVDSLPARASLMGLVGTGYQAIYTLRGRARANGPVRYFTRREVERMFSAFAGVHVEPAGLVTVPKSYAFFGKRLNRIYRGAIFDPVDRLARRVLPASAARFSPQFYNVVATR
jgi:ubiquinone/menaquinone biosynthesis C-methylase UbiE